MTLWLKRKLKQLSLKNKSNLTLNKKRARKMPLTYNDRQFPFKRYFRLIRMPAAYALLVVSFTVEKHAHKEKYVALYRESTQDMLLRCLVQ